MRKVLIAVVVIGALGGAGAGFWMMKASGNADFGKASPSADAADIPIDWFLTEGELSLGNAEIRTPAGVNVRLAVDSDAADLLVIDGLGVRAPLLADQESIVRFLAYKTGRYNIVLQSTGQTLGTLEIYQPSE